MYSVFLGVITILLWSTAIEIAVPSSRSIFSAICFGILTARLFPHLAIIEKINNSTPEQIKVAYGVTTEKAIEVWGITSSWIGKSTLETAKYFETLAKSKEVQTALGKTAEISIATGTIALGGAILAGEETFKQIGNVSNKISSWWNSI